jgi:glyoxylase-like metal-dependent hydrolase (beta-lactamase superfamily II)
VSATADRVIGCVTVLGSERGGKYPHGHSLLVRGADATAIIDPSLALIGRTDLPAVDLVLNSHCHEDHIAGNHLFTAARWHMPERDLLGIQSLDGLMQVYGYDAEVDAAFRPILLDKYHFTPRQAAAALHDGQVIELGGDVRVRVIHAPGHTRGHSLFHVEPADVLYLGDIDLSSFGPYYGDAWSSLPDFEQTLTRVRAMHAAHYATFHHIGVLDTRDAFLARLDRFEAVILDREARLHAYLAEPRTLDAIVAHRFVYTRGTGADSPFTNDVERRTMSQHLDRLVATGRVEVLDGARYQARA